MSRFRFTSILTCLWYITGPTHYNPFKILKLILFCLFQNNDVVRPPAHQHTCQVLVPQELPFSLFQGSHDSIQASCFSMLVQNNFFPSSSEIHSYEAMESSAVFLPLYVLFLISYFHCPLWCMLSLKNSKRKMAWREVKPNSLHFYVSDVLSWYRFIYTECSDILNYTAIQLQPCIMIWLTGFSMPISVNTDVQLCLYKNYSALSALLCLYHGCLSVAGPQPYKVTSMICFLLDRI